MLGSVAHVQVVYIWPLSLRGSPHLVKLLDNIFEERKKGIQLLSSGGQNINIKFSESSPDITKAQLSKIKNALCCKFILAYDSVITPSRTNTPPNWDCLTNVFYKYKYYPTNIPLRIIGWIVLYKSSLAGKNGSQQG